MTSVPLAISLCVAGATVPPSPPPPPPAQPVQDIMEPIPETTAGTLAGIDVGPADPSGRGYGDGTGSRVESVHPAGPAEGDGTIPLGRQKP